jgi:hypothetical protein
MAKLDSRLHPAKRLRNRYRLVVMNDDTYEEVTTFKLVQAERLCHVEHNICSTGGAYGRPHRFHTLEVLYTG